MHTGIPVDFISAFDEGPDSVSEAASPTVPDVEVEPRSKLKPNAAKWRPTGSIFLQEAFAVVCEVAQELQQKHGIDARATFCEHPGRDCDISLVANLKKCDSVVCCEEAAQESVRQRTSKTRGVLLIGFQHVPFPRKRSDDGFTCTLANATRKRTECRQFYRMGQCSGCQMEHPSSLVRIDFSFATSGISS